MRASVPGGVAALVVAVIVACTVAAMWLAGPAASGQPVVAGFAESLMGVPFGLVGAFIVARRPRNRLGWLFCAVGLTWAVQGFASAYGAHALRDAPGTLPGGVTLAWIGHALDPLAPVLLLFYVPLLYPDGRLPSRRWRVGVWVSVVLVMVSVAAMGFHPAPLTADDVPVAANPLGIAGAAGLLDALEAVVTLLFAPLTLAAYASLVLRFRRADGIVRQQLKWFLFVYISLVVFLVLLILGGLSGIPPSIWTVDLPLGLLILGVPVSLGLAIMRYRLYEIDRFISRTVSYAVLTGLLVAAYLGAVFALQELLRPAIGESQLAVAGATLLVAALFQPARRRVQGAVDRRFNRARHDAQRAVDEFRARMRDEVGLDQLGIELVSAVNQTVQPTGTNLWLRPGTSGR
jgi:hypothetical protein